MSYRNKTYVIFDADNDRWAYSYMRGWKVNDNIDFNFHDAHDIGGLTSSAQSEQYIKSKLRERFKSAKQAIVLIGEKTKNLYRYVRWELEVAQNLDLPIIAVNLNNKRNQDSNRVPPIIRDEYVVHISFKMKIIKYALNNFPPFFEQRDKNAIGPLYYPNKVYKKLGL